MAKEDSSDLWANIGPEGIKELMALGGYDEEQTRLAAQLASAKAMRSGKGPQGMHTGRTFIAANPMSHLASFLDKRGAKKDIKSTKERQAAIQAEQAAGRTRIAEAYMRQQQPPPQPPQQMGPPGLRQNPGAMGPPSPAGPPGGAPPGLRAQPPQQAMPAAPPPPPQPPQIPMGQPGGPAGSFDPKFMPQIAGSSGLSPQEMQRMAAMMRNQGR